jgi:hypothetical protein
MPDSFEKSKHFRQELATITVKKLGICRYATNKQLDGQPYEGGLEQAPSRYNGIIAERRHFLILAVLLNRFWNANILKTPLHDLPEPANEIPAFFPEIHHGQKNQEENLHFAGP